MLKDRERGPVVHRELVVAEPTAGRRVQSTVSAVPRATMLGSLQMPALLVSVSEDAALDGVEWQTTGEEHRSRLSAVLQVAAETGQALVDVMSLNPQRQSLDRAWM